MEKKEEAEEWQEYNKNDIDLNCYEYDENTGDFKAVRTVRVNSEITVGAMREKIAKFVSDDGGAYGVDDVFMLKIAVTGNTVGKP